MPRLCFTPTARRDLTEIAEFIAQDSPQAAGRVLAGIRRCCQKLAATPGLGRYRPEIGRDVQCFPTGNYLVFYRRRGEALEVLAVIHGARDVAQAMAERDA